METAFVAYALATHGLWAYKLQGPSGWPDRTVPLPGGGVLFLEFKSLRGSTRAHQVIIAARMLHIGHVVHFPRMFAEAVRILEEALSA